MEIEFFTDGSVVVSAPNGKGASTGTYKLASNGSFWIIYKGETFADGSISEKGDDLLLYGKANNIHLRRSLIGTPPSVSDQATVIAPDSGKLSTPEKVPTQSAPGNQKLAKDTKQFCVNVLCRDVSSIITLDPDFQKFYWLNSILVTTESLFKKSPPKKAGIFAFPKTSTVFVPTLNITDRLGVNSFTPTEITEMRGDHPLIMFDFPYEAAWILARIGPSMRIEIGIDKGLAKPTRNILGSYRIIRPAPVYYQRNERSEQRMTLNQGQEVGVVGMENEWLELSRWGDNEFLYGKAYIQKTFATPFPLVPIKSAGEPPSSVKEESKTELVKPAPSSTPRLSETATRISLGSYAVTDYTTVYAEPTIDGKQIATLEPDTRVQVVDHQGDWLKIVSKRGRPTGYIKRDSAKPVAGQPPD